MCTRADRRAHVPRSPRSNSPPPIPDRARLDRKSERKFESDASSHPPSRSEERARGASRLPTAGALSRRERSSALDRREQSSTRSITPPAAAAIGRLYTGRLHMLPISFWICFWICFRISFKARIVSLSTLARPRAPSWSRTRASPPLRIRSRALPPRRSPKAPTTSQTVRCGRRRRRTGRFRRANPSRAAASGE